jgi:hypothetical protein
MVIGHSSLILGCTLGAAWARLALEESRKVSWGEQSSILEFAGGCFRGAKDYSVEWLLVIQIGFWIDGGGEGVEPGKSDAVFMRTRSSNAHPMRKQCLGTALLERQTRSLRHTTISKQVLMGAKAVYRERSCYLLSKKRKVKQKVGSSITK